jgi:acylglycerol lipase
MKQDETFLSGRDGTQIYFRVWRPEGPARGALVIAHGFKAHGGLYGESAEHFAKHGLSVYAIDHRGHGNSGGERYEARDIAEFVDDLGQLVDLAKAREPASRCSCSDTARAA